MVLGAPLIVRENELINRSEVMSEPVKDKSIGGGATIVGLLLIALLLPVLYVLSIGPAAMIYHLNGDGPDWLAELYYPIEALTNALPSLQPIVEWYLELWVDTDG